MFVKIAVCVDSLPQGSFSVIASTESNGRAVINFNDTEIDIRHKEDVLEVAEGEDVKINLLFDGAFKETRTVHFNPSELKVSMPKKFDHLSAQGIQVKASLTVLERAPADWFETGLVALSEQAIPWYFKAEDLYDFIKYLINAIEIPKYLPSLNDICRYIDLITLKAFNKLLFINLDDGFSIISEIDSYLDHIFSTLDNRIDITRYNLAIHLQKLRKAITSIIQTLATTQRNTTADLKARISTLQERNSSLLHILSDAIEWANLKTENATAWMNTEREETMRQLRALQENSISKLTQAQATLLSTPVAVYNTVSNEFSHHFADAQETIKTLPVIAHPYVHGAVEATQPYVSTALTKAYPYLETLKSTPFVEHIIIDTKDAIQKHDKVNSLLNKVISNATIALDEVTSYCTKDDYYEMSEPLASSEKLEPYVYNNEETKHNPETESSEMMS